MKLEVIINEIQAINEADELLTEADFSIISDFYKKSKSKLFNIFKQNSTEPTKKEAEEFLKKHENKLTLVQKEVSETLLSNDISGLLNKIKSTNNSDLIDYVSMLVIAHGGEKKFLQQINSISSKSATAFRKVFDAIKMIKEKSILQSVFN